MPSTAEEVAEHLAQDPILEEVLARGILNLRRASRWMIEQEGWDASEEAVVSALRRFTTSDRGNHLRASREALRGAETGVRTNLALQDLGTGRLPDPATEVLQDVLDAAGKVTLLSGQRGARVLMEHPTSHATPERAQGFQRRTAIKGVAAVRVSFPEPGPGANGAAAIIANALAQGGVRVLESFSCAPEFYYVVVRDQAVQAYEIVTKLVGAV